MKLSDHIQPIVAPLRASQHAGQVILGLTTFFTIGVVTLPLYSNYLPTPAAFGMAFLSAYFGRFVIDGTLDKLIPVAFTRFELTTKEERRFMRILYAVVVVLFAVTGTVTWYGLPEISNRAIDEVDTSDSFLTIRKIQDGQARTLADQRAYVTRMEQGVTDAEKQGEALVKAAINANAAAARLWKSGNSWVRVEPSLAGYRAKIARAERDKRNMVASAQSKLNEARNKSQSVIASTTANADKAIQELSSITTNQIEKREQRIAGMTNVLFIIDVVLVLIVAILAYLIGLVGGHEIRERKTSLGVMFEIMDARGEQALTRAIEWLMPRNGATPKRNAMRNVAPNVMPVGQDEYGINRALMQIEAKLQPLSDSVTRNAVTPTDSGATRDNADNATVDVTDQKALRSAIRKERATLRSYQHKERNGVGKSVTNKAGMDKALREIERLEKLLK